jgi:hypothetical protein
MFLVTLLIVVLIINHSLSEKFLQAAKALNCSRALDAEHPELHVRIVDYQIIGPLPFLSSLSRLLTAFTCIVSTLPQAVPDPMGPLVKETLATLLPDEVSPETFNSQYLQRNSTSPTAVFAAAQASQKLGTPQKEVEESIFTTLDLALNVKVLLSQYLPFLHTTLTVDCTADCLGDHSIPEQNSIPSCRRVPRGLQPQIRAVHNVQTTRRAQRIAESSACAGRGSRRGGQTLAMDS